MERPALTPDMPRRDAVVSMLIHYLVLARQRAGEWSARPDDERLHQFRITLRRCRMLLRVFNADVSEHGGKALRAELTRVADRLGSVRDTDVIIQLVRESRFHRSGRNEQGVEMVLELTRAIREKGLKSVRRMGDGVAWSKTIDMTDHFIRRLETDKADPADQTIKAFLDREYMKYGRRMATLVYVARSDDSEMLHEFRVRLRRFRYLGDMLEELADKEQRKVFKRVHACEKTLGQVHDVDVALAFFARHLNKTPLLLKRELMELRRARLVQFRKKWKKYREKAGI